MSDLTERINIGKDTAAKLMQVGINTVDELITLGTEQAFIRLQALDAGACLSLLYGIDGAISNTKWNKISTERKQELKTFHKQILSK